MLVCLCACVEVFLCLYVSLYVCQCVCSALYVAVFLSVCYVLCVAVFLCLFCMWQCFCVFVLFSLCGSVSVHDLVTPLALFSSPGNRATITNYRSRAVRPNTIAIPITRQFSRRGKMMSGGLSIRWQLAWLPHHI